MEFGKTFKNVRLNKAMTAKRLCDNIMTPQQMSNFERGEQMLSADKFVILLSRMNISYHEFLFLLKDEYLFSKYELENELSSGVKKRNITKLKNLANNASVLFEKYDDIFFEHIDLIAKAMIQLIEFNYDYSKAKEYLIPIKNYLTDVEGFGYYEIKLVGQCIFMFEIGEAIFFGERAIESIRKYHPLYKSESDGCVLHTNMAIYALDYKEYHHLALEYAQSSINLATLSNDLTRVLNAQIVKQVVHFKLGDGRFNEHYLISLVNVFKLIDWHTEYKFILKFIKKHGITVE